MADPLNELIRKVTLESYMPTYPEALSLAFEIERQRRVVTDVVEAIKDHPMVDGRTIARLLRNVA
jgi:hypothetical protein